MSRLDSFIRRLEAQRACLGFVAGQIRDVAGPVLEFGLGNGRTYDHLRELLPERDIFVFERGGISERGRVVGKFRATGVRPICMGRLRGYGIRLSDSIFREERAVRA